MMVETIQVVRGGLCIREFPSQFYTLNIFSGIVTVIDRETRKIVTVISPNVFDYIEMAQQEVSEGEDDE